jgi:hypothetical protein
VERMLLPSAEDDGWENYITGQASASLFV